VHFDAARALGMQIEVRDGAKCDEWLNDLLKGQVL
jgi:hypothetical protein